MQSSVRHARDIMQKPPGLARALQAVHLARGAPAAAPARAPAGPPPSGGGRTGTRLSPRPHRPDAQHHTVRKPLELSTLQTQPCSKPAMAMTIRQHRLPRLRCFVSAIIWRDEGFALGRCRAWATVRGPHRWQFVCGERLGRVQRHALAHEDLVPHRDAGEARHVALQRVHPAGSSQTTACLLDSLQHTQAAAPDAAPARKPASRGSS